MDGEYQFRIADSFTPATIPMGRLSEYVAALADLLGETGQVHFTEVESGSVKLKARVDPSARMKVRDRVRSVRNGDATRDASKAFNRIDDMLREDNASGTLAGDDGAVVIPFPGTTRAEPLVFAPFRQDCALDGQVFAISGRGDSKNVHIRDGAVEYTKLTASHDRALELRHHLFGAVLRFHGEGTWFRCGDGTWELRNFRISNFEELDDRPLSEIVASLRKVKGSDWHEVPDPVRALLEDRYGNEDAN